MMFNDSADYSVEPAYADFSAEAAYAHFSAESGHAHFSAEPAYAHFSAQSGHANYSAQPAYADFSAEPACGFSEFFPQGYLQGSHELFTRNKFLKNREEELMKQLEEERVISEELRMKLMGFMKQYLPLEEEKNKVVLQYDDLKNKYGELQLSKDAVAMHNKQLSGLVADQSKEIKLTKKKMDELIEKTQVSKKEEHRINAERKRMESNCRTAIASIVKAAEVLKRKKLLPVECSRRITFWKKMLAKLTSDSTNNSVERSDGSDLSDDSEIEAMGDLLQNHLAYKQYPGTGENVENIKTDSYSNNNKNYVHVGINTDVSVCNVKNVGVQTLFEGSECTVKSRSIFSPELDSEKEETQNITFSCGSGKQFDSCGRLSVCSDSSSSDDVICFGNSSDLIKDQNITNLHPTPLLSNGCNKSTSFGRWGTVDTEMSAYLEKLTVSKLSADEATTLLNKVKKVHELETEKIFEILLKDLTKIKYCINKDTSGDIIREDGVNSSSGTFSVLPCNTLSKDGKKKQNKKRSRSHLKFM